MDKEIQKFKEKYPNLCEAFSTVELEQLLLFAKKCTDYGMDNISGGSDLSTPESVQFALNGIWYRIQDKLNRWKHCVVSGYGTLTNESLLDTFQDIVNYAIIAQLVARGSWKA